MTFPPCSSHPCPCCCPAVSLPFNKCFLRPRQELVPVPGPLLSTGRPSAHPLGPSTDSILHEASPGPMPPGVSPGLPPPCPASPLVTVLEAIWAPVCLARRTRTPSRAGLTHLGVPDTAQHRRHGSSEKGWPRALMSLLQAFASALLPPGASFSFSAANSCSFLSPWVTCHLLCEVLPNSPGGQCLLWDPLRVPLTNPDRSGSDPSLRLWAPAGVTAAQAGTVSLEWTNARKNLRGTRTQSCP